MSKIKRHKIGKWEVSLLKFRSHEGEKFKVTRRLPELSVAETKVFTSRRKAKKQFDAWLK